MWAIVVGAGAGTRFGRPKQFESLGAERVIDRSVRTAAAACSGVVVVLPGEAVASWDTPGTVAVAGGASRAESVANGLAAVPAEAAVVCVHDAARPLADADLYARVVAAVLAGADGAVPGLPVADTIKVVDDGSAVVTTPDRATLVAVQTPQAFRADVLRAAHADPALAGDPAITDDASMLERRGCRVVVVPGERDNRKITDPDDLAWARERA